MSQAIQLDRFDRTGVGCITSLGGLIGPILCLALMSERCGTPLAFAIQFLFAPGAGIGIVAAKLFGAAAGLWLAAFANSLIYGILWYRSIRLVNLSVAGLPAWSRRVALTLRSSRRS